MLDFRSIGAKYTLDGVEYDYSPSSNAAVSGNALSNTVWAAPGVSLDARQLLAGTDTVLFGGRWSDYSKVLNADGGSITFSRTVDGKVEKVIVANGQLTLQQDLLVFADGSVRTDTARKALINQGLSASVNDLIGVGASTAGNAADDWNPSVTSSNPGPLLPESPGGSVRGLASSPASFALPTPGVVHVLTGSSGVDQVYITPGAMVDARQLLDGEDQIFFTGKWEDYTKSLDSVAGTITFTRTVDGKTEIGIVGNGELASTPDLLVFADGAVRTDTVRLALTENLKASVADLKAQGALTTSTAADDWKDTTFTRWGVKAPLIDAVSGDDKVNSSEKQAGVLVSGSAEANSKLELKWDGVHKSVTADADGKWSATFASGEVPADSTTVLSVTAADSTGYVSAPTTRNVLVDTVVTAPVIDQVATDNRVNASEKSAGVAVTGTAEADSSVKVVWGSVEKSVTAGIDGQWSANFPSDEVPADGDSTLSAVAMDKAGNVSVPTQQVVIVDTKITGFTIDTIAGDDVINASEKAAGVAVTGTGDPNSLVILKFGFSPPGHVTLAQVDSSGHWSTSFNSGEILTDAIAVYAQEASADGKVLTTRRAVTVDTAVSAPVINAVTADNIVNATEKAAGVSVTGTAEAGSSVKVVWGAAAHTVTAGIDGKWSSSFANTEVPADGNSSISVVTTDVAGNVSASVTKTVMVDTTALAAPVITHVGATSMTPSPYLLGDNDQYINDWERDRFIVQGTAKAGASVDVQLGGKRHTVLVQSDGSWATNFTPAEIPRPGSKTTLTAVVTDKAGNNSTATRDLIVDTIGPEISATIDPVTGDDVINASERAAGVTVTGTAEANGHVGLIIDPELGDRFIKVADVDSTGHWSIYLSSNELQRNIRSMFAAGSDAAWNLQQHEIAGKSITYDTRVAAPTISADTTAMLGHKLTHAASMELNPVLSSDVAGVTNFDVRSNIVLKSSLAGHLADGTWTIKVVSDANDTSHPGYRGENHDNSQALTFSVANGVITDLSGGDVSLSADGKSIILNPTFDLDLSNNYHIETSAGMFQAAGGGSDAFNGAHFSTVTPGAYSSTDTNLGGRLAQKFDESGDLAASQRWVDMTGNGCFTGTQVSINAGNGDYAFVAKDLSGAAPGSGQTTSDDGVSIDGDLNVLLTNFGKSDLLYIDQQDNAAPKNDLTQSTFQAGDGHGTPLEYVSGADGTSQDGLAKVDLQLESGLQVSSHILEQVVSEIHSNTGVVISG
ncbi:hypothetical protein A3218_00685 [Pseudomonas chlororaphis]|nr:hypothetical protein A3218_00685 [Pseudomonas chlororaphis]